MRTQVTRNTTWILPLFLIGGLAFFVRYSHLFFSPGPANQDQSQKQEAGEQKNISNVIQSAFAELNADLKASEQHVLNFIKDRKQARADQENLFPAPADANLHREFLEEYKQFQLQAVEYYLNQTKDSETAKPSSEKFLTAFINWECETSSSDENIPQEIIQLAEKAIEDGSNDDTIRACYAGVLLKNNRMQEALDAMIDLHQKEAQLQIAPTLVPMFQIWLLNASQELEESQYNIQTRRRQMLISLIEFLKLDQRKDQERFFWLLFDNNVQLDRTGWNEFLQALFQHPEIPIYHKQLAMGKFRVKFAGEERKPTDAPLTPEQQELELQKTLLQAVPYFLRAWHLEPQNPDAPYELLKIAVQIDAPGWRSADWFHEIISIEFDHQDAYNTYFESLQSKSQHAELLSLASSCLQTARWETPVPSFGLNAIEDVMEDSPLNEELGKNPEIAGFASNFAAAYLEQTENQNQQSIQELTGQQLGLLTGILVQSGNYEPAAKLFKLHGKRMTDDAFLWAHRNRDSFHREVLAMTGPAANEIKALTTSHLPADQKVVEQILEKDPRPEVALFATSLRLKQAQAEQFEKGEWVDLTFQEGLPGWFVDADETHILSDKAIVLREFQQHGNLQLRPDFQFEAPYQIEVVVKLFAIESLRSPTNRVAIALGGSRSPESRTMKFAEFGITMNGVNVAHLNSQTPDGEVLKLKPILHISDTYRLSLEVWPDRALMYVNNQPVIDDENLAGIATNMLSFGTIISDKLTPRSIRLENPRFRKLSVSQEDSLLVYTQKLVQLHPYHPKAYFLHGKSFRDLNQYDAARKEFEKALLLKPDYEEAKRSLAFCYGALRDFRRAILILEGLVNESTTDPILMNELAWNLIVCDDKSLRNAPRAISLAKAACEQSNFENPNIISTLASAYAEHGEFEKAVETLQLAIKIADPQLQIYLKERLTDYSESRAIHETQP
ncbi:tetratricopeptide repeat protein [Thalassoglobus sp.]|uniref:tetratricopeptide repeat protein n=1 Tax=Thalassoglobus sp. TaxID=2795869 RepID=UPI003AA93FC9